MEKEEIFQRIEVKDPTIEELRKIKGLDKYLYKSEFGFQTRAGGYYSVTHFCHPPLISLLNARDKDLDETSDFEEVEKIIVESTNGIPEKYNREFDDHVYWTYNWIKLQTKPTLSSIADLVEDYKKRYEDIFKDARIIRVSFLNVPKSAYKGLDWPYQKVIR